MAINRRALNKVEEYCDGNQAMLGFLRELLVFEVDSPGRYTEEYEKLLEDYSKGGKHEV